MFVSLRLLLPVLGVLVFSASSSAQTSTPEASSVAGCSLGSDSARLELSSVRARLYNMGGLFWRGGGTGYDVPFSDFGGLSPLYAAGIWVSGDIGGETRFAGATYSDWEFWPGPLDADGETTAARCDGFDNLWKVNIFDLQNISAGPFPSSNPDLVGWPIAQGAPYFLDTNGNNRRDASEPRLTLGPGDPGYSLTRGGGATLDLAGGYRPDLVGDEAVWWIMNDNGNDHAWSGSAPLRIEVQVLAYSFATAGYPLSQTTVYEYTLVNRGPTSIDDSRLSFFADFDIGTATDDFLASDADRGMLIGYNGDGFDEGASGYSISPPALGIDLLSGAESAIEYRFYSPVPTDTPGSNRFGIATKAQRATWGDGVPLTVGADGYDPESSAVTQWMYGGDPVRYGFWTEEQPVLGQRRRAPGDRQGVVTTPAVTLAPGESRQVDIAILFSMGNGTASPPRTRLHNVSRLRDISDAVQAAYDGGDLRATSVSFSPPPAAPANAVVLASPADGVDYNADRPETLVFEWTAVTGADAYRLEMGSATSYTTSFEVASTSLTLDAQALPSNLPLTQWRVIPLNWGGDGPASEARTFAYTTYEGAPLPLSDGTPAFVEVVGPGGVDPCGPEATSTSGCEEVGGNAINNSLNSTGEYYGRTPSGTEGTDRSIGAFGPNDFEIRFTAEGSYAYYAFSTGGATRVPFEIWDIGLTRPGTANDPSDDVQLVPVLLSSVQFECGFFYGSPQITTGPVTPRIYAYYADDDDYAAWESAIAPLVAADPSGCPTDPITSEAAEVIDFDRGRPIQRFMLEQTTDGVGIDGLAGTVIRFYTADPYAVDTDAAEPTGALRLSVRPNPAGAIATVPYTVAQAGPVRLRVVDVLGREVAVLADGFATAGSHEATLDTTPLAAGVYVLVLDADGQRTSQSITVVR